MRRLLSLLIGLLVFLPALAFAEPVSFITLGAIMEHPVYQEGEPVFLALVLHSNSTKSYFIGGSAFEEASFDIAVTDSAGKAVPRTAVGERVLTSPTRVYSNGGIVLAPGRSLLYRFNLARLFDLSRTGTYTINVSRRLRPEIWVSEINPPAPPSTKTSRAAPPPAIETPPQMFTLTVNPLTVRMTEDATAVSGSTAYALPPSRQPSLYTVGPNTDGIFHFNNNIASAIAPTPLMWGPVSGGLSMTAHLPADVLPANEPVVVTVILKNVTKRPIRLGASGTDISSFRLSVAGPKRQSPGVLQGDGEPLAGSVPLLGAGHDLLDAPGSSVVPIILPPGGQRQYRFVLSRLVDMTVAGHYTVQITHTLPGGVEAVSPTISLLLDGPFNGITFNVSYSVQIR